MTMDMRIQHRMAAQHECAILCLDETLAQSLQHCLFLSGDYHIQSSLNASVTPQISHTPTSLALQWANSHFQLRGIIKLKHN